MNNIQLPSSNELDPEGIEFANAHGPYSHGNWATGNAMVGNEEALKGRGALLVSKIRSAILSRFTLDQLRTMTLLDVGCYDGWLTCQIAELPFRSIIGVEPRQKNLDKGQTIRNLLGIETRCEFRRGSIETLDEVLEGKKAEVVICVGLLHHLSSIPGGIAKLCEVCSHFLFLETLCLPAAMESRRLRDALELKDLPYFFGDQGFGITGHKLESGYYDGSATNTSVVSVPSVNALRMFLSVQGFTNIEIVADPETYKAAVKGGWRRISAICLTAEIDARNESSLTAANWIEAYEEGLMHAVLPPHLAQALYEFYVQGRSGRRMDDWRQRIAFRAVTSDRFWRGVYWRLLRGLERDRFVLEIYKNIQHAPGDKAALEYGKCLLVECRHADAEYVLLGITRRLNADWRSVYRAFCLLAWSFKARGDETQSARYVDLCRIANPQFPEKLLLGSLEILKSSRPATR
jgi:hypothetical protein